MSKTSYIQNKPCRKFFTLADSFSNILRDFIKPIDCFTFFNQSYCKLITIIWLDLQEYHKLYIVIAYSQTYLVIIFLKYT